MTTEPARWYLAVDPGGTTGFAWYEPSVGVFASEQIAGRAEAETFIRAFLDRIESPVVIIERWDVRKDTFGKSAQDDARYIIGWVEGECRFREVPYHEQTPAQAKRFADDLKLKRLGWYRATPGGHANDATRHLVHHLCTKHGAGDGASLLRILAP